MKFRVYDIHFGEHIIVDSGLRQEHVHMSRHPAGNRVDGVLEASVGFISSPFKNNLDPKNAGPLSSHLARTWTWSWLTTPPKS